MTKLTRCAIQEAWLRLADIQRLFPMDALEVPEDTAANVNGNRAKHVTKGVLQTQGSSMMAF